MFAATTGRAKIVLKPRIIGVVAVKDGWAVQSIGFRRFLPLGRPEISVEFLDRYGIDEIALLDISATREGRGFDLTVLQRCAQRCHVPIAAGGGVTTIAQMHDLIRSGADKIIINTAALENPTLVSEGAAHFGSQCMVMSIDARRTTGRDHEVYSHCGTRARGMSPQEGARIAQEHGAGEILINSIDQDGAKNGYDLDLVQKVRDAASVPLISLGGAGHAHHFAECLRAGANAAAAGNIFNYAEHSVALVKRQLAREGVDLRFDTHAAYENATFDTNGRLLRQPEEILDDLLFMRIKEEVI